MAPPHQHCSALGFLRHAHRLLELQQQQQLLPRQLAQLVAGARCHSSTTQAGAAAAPPPAAEAAGASGYDGSSSSTEEALRRSSGGTGSSEESALRRGFGAKVALPQEVVLRRVLVQQPATLKLRAYHVGSRIHIGQVLARLRVAQQGHLIASTTVGRDFCIVWLFRDAVESAQQQLAGATAAAAQQQQQQPRPGLQQYLRAVRLQQLPVVPRLLRNAHQQLLDSLKQADHAAAGQQQQGDKQQQQQQQQQRRRQQPTHALQHPWQLQAASVPPLLVVYRVGSVVFAGTRQQDEAALLQAVVPSSVLYKAENPWTGDESTTGSITSSTSSSSGLLLQPAEEHTVVIDPSLTAAAAKDTDAVKLPVLDIGAVRVLTSVLAHSAALAFYERNVSAALETLNDWKSSGLRAAAARHGGVARLVSALSGQQEDKVLFRVIAASALVIEEARRLLEVAEPAWNHDRYHDIWSVMHEEFELQPRFHALEVKLNQVEQEAKHDFKSRARRRYQHLEELVVALLVASCTVALLGAAKKLLERGSASSSGGGEDDAGAAAGDGGPVMQHADGSADQAAALDDEAGSSSVVGG